MRYLPMIGEVWGFMRVKKKFWIGPVILILLLIGMALIASSGSAFAPFIYSLF